MELKESDFSKQDNKNMNMKIHIVMCSHGEPFDTVKKLTLDTASQYTTKKIVIHDYSFERIQQSVWFPIIKDLPLVKKIGARDGYYVAYKVFCCWEVYQTIGEKDVLFYLDSSQYYKDGFTKNMDKLCEIAYQKGFIAGSTGNDLKNSIFSLCTNFNVWKKILPECDKSVLNKLHILNAWYVLRKDPYNTLFMKDWIYWSMYTDADFPDPLITYHLTADQSIFNILVHKYNMHIFYDKTRGHCQNKNKNAILDIINKSNNPDSLFIKLDPLINMLVVVVSCKKHEHLWPTILSRGIENIIILCGSNETKLEDKMLYLNCSDDYVGLAEKITCAHEFILKSEKFKNVTHVLTTEDNNTIFNGDKIKEIQHKHKDILTKHDYIGQYIFGPPHNICRRQHYRRTDETSIWYKKEFSEDWVPFLAGGATYILSRKSLVYLNLNKDEYIKYGSYEDVMVANILNKYNIKPYKLDYGITCR